MRFVIIGAISSAIILGAVIGGGGGGGGGTTPTFYIAQSAAGSQDGSSCANAQSAAYFNTAGNWGVGHSIHPDTIVGLCGTVTSTLTFQGDGTSGHPIELYFTAGSKISQAICTCIVIDGRSWVTIDGGGTPSTTGNGAGLSATQGLVEATANGDGLANQSGGSAVGAHDCNHCIIENLLFHNLFVRVNGTDDSGWNTGGSYTRNSALGGFNNAFVTGCNITFSHNVVDAAGWAIYYDGGGSACSPGDGIHIDHSEFGKVDHAFATSGGDVTGMWFNNNYVHDMGVWDCSCGQHHDAIHCFTIGAGSNGNNTHNITDFYIYDNVFGKNVGSNTSYQVWTGAGQAPPNDNAGCDGPTDNVWFFNNVCIIDNSGVGGPCLYIQTGRPKIFSNSLESYSDVNGSGANVCNITAVNGTVFEDNVCEHGDNLVGMDPPASGTFASGSPDYNDYADYGWNTWNSSSCAPFTQNFATWQTCMSNAGGAGEAHSLQNGTTQGTSAGLDWTVSNGIDLAKPNAGSSTINNGADMTATCNSMTDSAAAAACKKDIDGTARPNGSAWYIGAYQSHN